MIEQRSRRPSDAELQRFVTAAEHQRRVDAVLIWVCEHCGNHNSDYHPDYCMRCGKARTY